MALFPEGMILFIWLRLLLAAGKVKKRCIHTGEAGDNNADHNTFQKKIKKTIRFPKYDFREKIQEVTDKNCFFIPDLIRQNPPWKFQQKTESEGNALNNSNLKDRDPPCLAIERGYGAIEYHSLQKSDGIHKINISCFATEIRSWSCMHSFHIKYLSFPIFAQ